MDDTDRTVPPFLQRLVEFREGKAYKLEEPLTSYRVCHDGTPVEARMVFACRQVGDEHTELIMKVKVQVPGESAETKQLPEAGPSTTTAAELKALEIFRKSNSPCTPHLVDWKSSTQGPDCPLPGGYLTYTVMSKMPGQMLLDLKYWDIPTEEQEEIIREFLIALRSIYELGIEPIDRALRNVIWERETKKWLVTRFPILRQEGNIDVPYSSIIDFELWQETSKLFADETRELQRWGLVRRPPPRDWWDEWSFHTR